MVEEVIGFGVAVKVSDTQDILAGRKSRAEQASA